MVDITTKILALLLSPPGVIVVLALFGFLIQIRWLIAGNIIVALSVTALLILSLPLTGQQLMAGVESRFAPLRLNATPETGPRPGAIVILGGGRYSDATEYGEGDSVNRTTLERLRYGAYLYRLTGLPILVSGGTPYSEAVSEATLMQTALARDFQVKIRWVEGNSATTYENAKYSKAILAEAGVRHVYLVTHASHMPRAVQAFETMGIATTPAPMGFTTLSKQDHETLGYYPSAYGLQLSSAALRERLGLAWYKYKYGAMEPPMETTPGTTR